MRESLYDRFRPFKPYDLALAVVILVLVAFHGEKPPSQQAMILGGGIALLAALEMAQRFVHVPTPAWQSLPIVCVNTGLVAAVDFLEKSPRFSMAFYMLNVAFAAVAFGQRIGIAAAVLSAVALGGVDFLANLKLEAMADWPLFLVVLLTLVAILVRISRLQQDALFDAVTGLRNHRYFQQRLRDELERGHRNGQPTSLLLLDLDFFKSINDRFGHAVGDHILSEVARVLERNARAADVVCRYGGEEIVVILPGTGLSEATQVAERLRQAVEKRNDRPGPAVTVSIGVAAAPDHADQSDGLIVAADAAMYSAKRAGRNRVMSAPVPVPVQRLG